MRPQKIDDTSLILGLMSVLRNKGFEGASMADLSEATSLKKASLYHRFPDGKETMAKAVLEFVGEWIHQQITEPLTDSDRSVEERLNMVLSTIRGFYEDGAATCILRALSMGDSLDKFGPEIKVGMEQWIAGFTQLGLDAGFSQNKAKQLAISTLVDVQGSLIVAKGLNDLSIFVKAIEAIATKYLA